MAPGKGELVSELDVVKYVVQAGFAGIAVFLALILYRAIGGFLNRESGLMKIVDRLLAGMFDRFGEIMAQQREDMKTLVVQMQEHQDQMVERIGAQMAPVMQRRDAKEDMIHDDVKAVPAQTQKLVQDDLVAQTENIRLAFEQTLAETEKRINANLALMGEVQQVAQGALDTMKVNMALALDQLKAIQEIVSRIEQADQIAAETPPIVAEPQPETAPPSTTVKIAESVSGTP